MRRRFWRRVACFAAKRAGGRFVRELRVEYGSVLPWTTSDEEAIVAALRSYERRNGRRILL